MLAVGTTGKLSGVPCRVTSHVKSGAGRATSFQLLEFDTFTGWNWQGSSAPSTALLYNLDTSKYYHWYDIRGEVPPFVSDVEPMADTLRSVALQPMRQGCNCIHCNDENKLAEPNMTGGRFMCFGCRSTDRWRYEGEFI